MCISTVRPDARPALRCWLLLLVTVLTLAANPASHLQRSVQLMQDGNLEAAEAEAHIALQDAASKAVALALLGSIRLQQERYDEGIEYLERAIAADPNLVGARLNLAQAYGFQGRGERAGPLFRDVLRAVPENASARLGLARLEAEQGNHAEALQVARPIEAQLRDSPDGLLLLATCYAAANRRDDARSLVADWTRLERIPAPWTVKFALTLANGGLNREGIQLLEGLRSEGVETFEVAFNLGGLYLLEGDLEKASKSYELAVEIDDQSVPALKQVATIAEAQGQLEKALSFLIRAKLEAPDDPEVLFSFGTVALRLELVADATASLKLAHEARPGHKPTRYWLATAFGAARQYDSSLELYQGILQESPDDPQMHYAVGTVHYLKVEFEDAVRHLTESHRLDPDQLLSNFYLAMIAQKQGNNLDAVDMFEKILQQHPGHGLSHEGLAVSQFRLGRHEEARKSFETAIRIDPKSARANYQLGQLLVRMGLREEAQSQLAVARELREEEERAQIVKTLLNPH